MTWAVRIDGAGSRSVDGPFEDPENPSKLFPDYKTEYYLAEADGPPPAPVELPAQIEADMTALLDAKLRQATAHVAALQGRVDTINDAIAFGKVLPEEIAELPAREAQLNLWKYYRVDLGRVKSAPGWFNTPAWPEKPELYTSETSASQVSAQ